MKKKERMRQKKRALIVQMVRLRPVTLRGELPSSKPCGLSICEFKLKRTNNPDSVGKNQTEVYHETDVIRFVGALHQFHN